MEICPVTNKVQVRYEFLGFKFEAADGIGLVNVEGRLMTGSSKEPFTIVLSPLPDGEWQFRGVRTAPNPPKWFGETHVIQAMVNRVGKLLKSINMWAGESGDNGAKVVLNELLAPEEVRNKVSVSFRPGMLAVPTAKWSLLWELIEGRAAGDPFFCVQGFSAEEIGTAIAELKHVFPATWVRASYRRALAVRTPRMAAPFPPGRSNWFPAYHLARTALGAICIDPGWNYLLEIGLSISELQGFDGLKKLKKQLARSPGTQHHLCLAAELFRNGKLIALEPPTGSGSSTSDLMAKAGDSPFQVEVKEFQSKKPFRRLCKELERKARVLPAVPSHPVLFHVVLVENGMFDKEKEENFKKDMLELKHQIPPKISAVVAGRRFVDSSGGRIKRDSKIQVHNPNALVAANPHVLAKLFERNYQSVAYPMYGIGSFMYFDTDSTPTG